MEKDFLGTGWKYPLSTDSNGRIAVSKYEECIKESILIILRTAKGERLMRPDFGCSIHEYAYSTTDTLNLRMIENTVYEALVQWEPRIEVLGIKTSNGSTQDGKLLISIDYKVRASNTQFNLVYPFYLNEGL